MTELRQAAQQALEALECCRVHYGQEVTMSFDEGCVDNAITALRTALKQQAEPIGWLDGNDKLAEFMHRDLKAEHDKRGSATPKDFTIPVYTTAPQQQAEPVGEVTAAVDGAFKCEFSQHLPVGTKLYTAPQQQAEPDRRDLQAAGTHPAPCARHCEARAFEIEIRSLNSRLKQQAEPVAWTPVAEALPKSGVKVLACYRNRLGNLRRIRAMWTAAKTEEADSDDLESLSEYDEATDTHYVTEGWYECIDNWGDYSSVAVTEGEVTHWMPLPHDPYTDPPQRKPLTIAEVEQILAQHNYEIHGDRARYIVRMTEEAHGIQEPKQ